jgi:sugar phosphate isomerase/epimerase
MEVTMNRRQFLQTAVGVTIANLPANPSASPSGGSVIAESKENKEKAMAAKWQIGCFNRPWSNWSYDEALDGMQAAGFHLTGFLGDHKGEAFIYPEATAESLDNLHKRCEARGLKVTFGRMRARHDGPLEETIALVHKQVDHASRMHLKYLMTLGTDKPEEYDHFYHVMADASAYAQPRGIQIVFKPHGGCSASADEILHCIERVDHPNFRLWYDAGNIIHYTGKDPVADVERVARYVTGFCAKDCAGRGGDVMIQLGEGKVDFGGVFRKLKAAGFQGPVMIECCGGQTQPEVIAKARENRLFLERLFASSSTENAHPGG